MGAPNGWVEEHCRFSYGMSPERDIWVAPLTEGVRRERERETMRGNNMEVRVTRVDVCF